MNAYINRIRRPPRLRFLTSPTASLLKMFGSEFESGWIVTHATQLTIQSKAFSDIERLEIPMENAFQRLLLHTIIAQEFPEVHSYSSKKGAARMLCIYRSQTEVYDEQLRGFSRELTLINDMVGVRKIFDAVSQQGKLFVGHNCFFDILHLYHSFYEDLPASIADFKMCWTSRFPHSFDTKYLAEAHELLSPLQPPSSLKGLCDFMAALTVSEQERLGKRNLCFAVENIDNSRWRLPVSYHRLFDDNYAKEYRDSGKKKESVDTLSHFSVPSETTEDSDYVMDDMSHEAGFDSLMTSVLFICQCSHILRTRQHGWTGIRFPTSQDTEHHQICGTINPVKHITNLLPLMDNRIRLVRTQPNVVNLGAKDDVDMSKHLYLTGLPPTWKKWDVMKALSPISVITSWVNANSCWVIARSEEDVNSLLMIYRLSNPLFTLHTYEEYKKLQQQHGIARHELLQEVES